MNQEKKIKTLIGIVVFLLLSNIAMLLFFVVLNVDNKKHPGNRDNLIGMFLKNDVGFSSQQMTQYDTMRNEHLRKMKPLFEGLKSAKDSFYNLLYPNTFPDIVLNSMAAIIGERQLEIDRKFFNHLLEVRKLCKPEQLPKFDSSFKDVVSKITGRSRKTADHINKK